MRKLNQLPQSARAFEQAQAHWRKGEVKEAIALFQKEAQLNPSDADAHYNLGAALFGSGRLNEAITSFQRAIELRPHHLDAVRLMPNALEHLGKEKSAAEAYRTLASLTNKRGEKHLSQANAYRLENDPENSARELRLALALAPNNPAVHSALGQLLLEAGDFAQAEVHLRRSLEQYPDAFQQFSTVRKMTRDDLPLMESVAARLADPSVSLLQKSTAHFGLGKAYNDLGMYETAMSHFDMGNKLSSLGKPLSRESLLTHYDRLKSEAASLGRQAPISRLAPDEADLPILIVGMPRSGTTLVEQIISSHPDVVAGGELAFWSDKIKTFLSDTKLSPASISPRAQQPDLLGQLLRTQAPRSAADKASRLHLGVSTGAAPALPVLTPDDLRTAGVEYLQLLKSIGPTARRVTDKAPYNCERLGLIRLALPGVRIVHCRRNPIDNCLSIFFTKYKGRQGWSRGDILFQYRQYQALMDHWKSVISEDHFMEVDYEALVADSATHARRLIDFCGLPWDDACLSHERNAHTVRTASVWQARQPTYSTSVDRWRHYEPWIGELGELVGDQKS